MGTVLNLSRLKI